MNDRPVPSKKAILAALVSHGFWGFSFLASRTAMDEAPVMLLLSHRFLLAFLLMTLFAVTGLAKCDFKGKSVLPLLLLGFFQPVLYFFGEQYGILHSGTIFSGVMIALIPVVAAAAAIPILGEKPTLRQIVCGLVSVAGVIGVGLLTKSSGTLDWIGVAGLLTAVFSATAYLLLARGISERYTAFERAYAMMGVGSLVFTVLAICTVRGDLAAYVQPFRSQSYLLSVLFLGVCCSFLAFYLVNELITDLSVAQTAFFSNFSTAVSVFAGAVFLHEPFSLAGGVCCAVILLGIYGVNAPPRKRSDAEGEG